MSAEKLTVKISAQNILNAKKFSKKIFAPKKFQP